MGIKKEIVNLGIQGNVSANELAAKGIQISLVDKQAVEVEEISQEENEADDEGLVFYDP